MGDATILNKASEFAHIPGIEVVTLTLTDGETYQSRKFKTILAAFVCGNYAVDADTWVTFSGQTATVGWASQTDKTCSLMLFGKK